jgi:dTDP-4-dehydrorhamnose reductase
MKQLFISGISGFLGQNIARVAAEAGWHVSGSFRSSKPPGNVHAYPIEISDQTAWHKLLHDVNPDLFIHTAAISNIKFCEQHPQDSERINLSAAVKLASICADLNIPFFFCSSDLVFDGKKGHYREDDPVNPLMRYGAQKAAAEQQILESHPDALICRLPLLFGPSKNGNQSFLQHFVQLCRDGQAYTLFQDEIRTPVDAESIASGMLIAYPQTKGILHLGGREALNRYELGLKIARAFKLDKNALQAGWQKDQTFAIPRPANVSLNSEKAFSLGYNPQSIDTALHQIIPNHD